MYKRQVDPFTIAINDFAIITGHPCRVKSVQKSDPGKHGGRKIYIGGKDIFTGQQFEDIFRIIDPIQKIIPVKYEYSLGPIHDNNTCCVCQCGTDDIKKESVELPTDEIMKQIIKDHYAKGNEIKVTVHNYLDKVDIIVDYRIVG